MKILLLASLLALGACDTTGDFPVQPQGMPTGKGSASSGNIIIGRACVIVDPRVLNQCVTTGAGNLVVSLGSATAMTADDGSFQIIRAPGAVVPTSFSVSGSNI